MGRLLADISERTLPLSLSQQMGDDVQAELQAEPSLLARYCSPLGANKPLDWVHDSLRGVRGDAD